MIRTLIELLDDFFTVIGQLVDRVEQLMSDLWAHKFNPIRAADDIVRFLTGFIGIIVGAAGTYWIRNVRRKVATITRTRLITPENALKWTEDSLSDALQQITLTSDTGLFPWLAQTIGLWFWHLIKRFKLLRTLLNIETLDDVIHFFRKIFARRIAIIVIYSIVAIFTLLIATAMSITSAILLIYADNIVKYLLPQDSKRLRVHPKTVRKRFNLQAGPDTKT